MVLLLDYDKKIKVFILGIDGLDFHILKKWQKDLPNFENQSKNGSEFQIMSSIPALSVPAWQDIYSGKQSGKHGAFGFFRRRLNSYQIQPINFTCVKTPLLWNFLNHNDVSCGLFNIPLTYPPPKIQNGWIVAGWPAPTETNYSHPKNLEKELNEAVSRNKYFINPYPTLQQLRTFTKKWAKNQILLGLKMRFEALDFLVTKYPENLIFAVFTGIDTASHFLINHPTYLKECYMKMDGILGKIDEKLNENTLFLILSDHGFQKGEFTFHTNTWLVNENYLKIRGVKRSRAVLAKLGITQTSIYQILRKIRIIKLLKFVPQLIIEQIRGNLRYQKKRIQFDDLDVNWSETIAYSAGFMVISLNIAGREPLGCVMPHEAEKYKFEIKNKLNDFLNKQGLNLKCWMGTELYFGPYINEAPDIVFMIENMKCSAGPTLAETVLSKVSSGEHRPYSYFCAKGSCINNKWTGNENKNTIRDIFPTVLYYLNLPIPDDLDGKPMINLFSFTREPRFMSIDIKDEIFEISEEVLYDKEEEEKILERLRALGYI